MLSFIATVPDEELGSSDETTTVNSNSILLADPTNPDKAPEHYQFDRVSGISRPLTLQANGTKNELCITVFTKETPVDKSTVAADLESLIGGWMRAHPRTNSLEFQCGFVFAEKSHLEIANITTPQGLAPFLENASFEDCVFVAKCPFFGYIALPSYGNSASSNMRFLESMRDNGATKSEVMRLITACVFMYELIVVNYRFSPHGDASDKKSLLELSGFLESVVEKGIRAKKRQEAPSPRASFAVEDDAMARQCVGPDWTWRAAASARDSKTGYVKLDVQRLIYTAQRAADAPDVSGKTITEISQELDKQIGYALKFEEKATAKIEQLQSDYQYMKKAHEKLLAKKKETRLKYLKMKNNRQFEEKQKMREIIGSEGDDIDTTILVLELEIDAAKRDIEYLRAAFGEEGEEEEEEEAKEEEVSIESDGLDEKDFDYDESAPLDGIVAYLSREFGGNVAEKGIVAVTSSSVGDGNEPKNAVDFELDTFFESGEDDQNAWICYEFKEHRVTPTSYSIRSCDGDNNMKSWVFEVSKDGESWYAADSREDNDELNASVTCNFEVELEEGESHYRFVRLRQTGQNHADLYKMEISAFEIFGSISEQ